MSKLIPSQLLCDPASRAKAVAAALDYLTQHPVRCNDKYLVVVDMTSHSYKDRLHIYDRKLGAVINNFHVAHGSGSSDPDDLSMAIEFSNTDGTHMSSVGAMLTGDTYIGKHGLSRKLEGLEKGINDNVEARDIVIHAASYVASDYIIANGRAGQSWGCLAVAQSTADVIIPLLVKGTFVYVHH